MSIRPANPSDVPRIWELINELAVFEKLGAAVTGSQAELFEHMFGPKTYVQSLVAVAEGIVVGYALFFDSYSTFKTKPGIWLEDLYVTPIQRGRGFGKAMLSAVIELARGQGGGRVEWSVLDWNTSAIEFYESMGATVMPEWKICRVALS